MLKIKEKKKNVSDPQTPDLIINLEEKIFSSFDGLYKALLHLKDGIIKDLQVENQRLRMKVNNLENNVMSLEINGNHFEQYGRRNNLGITGIPDNVSNKNLEKK